VSQPTALTSELQQLEGGVVGKAPRLVLEVSTMDDGLVTQPVKPR
jgi:hypothetical protein